MPENTLFDSFGRKHTYLRISVTDACNLRCLYCMPDEHYKATPSANMLQPDEIKGVAEIFVKYGVNKIRLTGGEPLVRKDIAEIITLIAKLPVELTITTNGYLANEFIELFKESGMKSINIGLDTLDAITFKEMTRRNHFEKILSNIHLLLRNSFQVKINVVVMKGINEKSILDFVKLTQRYPLDVRFIEFMPFAGNNWGRDKVLSAEEIKTSIGEKFTIEKISDSPNDTSRKYMAMGHAGTFGFISTMTEPFCGGCNRLRLTADGKLKNCLFSNQETDLLTPFRNGENIVSLIKSCIMNKKKERAGIFDFQHIENRSMIAIGG
jgi:cyclic pyranopterin phosphate synthase